MQLVPVVPIFFAPLLILGCAIVFPVWVVALVVVGSVRVIAWPFEQLGRRFDIAALVQVGHATHRAWRWTVTFGGIAGKKPER